MRSESESTRAAGGGSGGTLAHVEDFYESWFLDYASYVILDRAVPHIKDGLKPVQRRILHALWELDDGRLNKAANIIGHTMRYHPHGDMAIEDALVKLAQKDLLIDMQGNWGNTFTGDRAAAPRYIEARLSTLAKEILFHEDLTEWQASYDGRNKEPLHLPVKFPLLLALGVEGIAVGLATKILPHNFSELCEAAMLHLQGKEFELLPDFASGGTADFSAYQEGQRGGKVRVRAKIRILDSKSLQIYELPYGTTTISLIESILAAHDKGKIKIKKVEDNTGYQVDIHIHLPVGVSAEQTLEALYAFTDCEISISVNCCVIQDEKPAFLTTRKVLISAVEGTREFLRRELELTRATLLAKIHKSSLEQIFIEQKIYRKLEGANDWSEALTVLQKAFKPFLKSIATVVTDADLETLLEMRFKRLTKYDSEQASLQLEKLRAELLVTESHLMQLTSYAISWFKSLKQRYGKAHKRKTDKAIFGELRLRELVLANQKLYINRQEGFLGTGLKKDEFLIDCSDMDEVLVVRRNGQATVIKVSEKAFVGEDIFYASLLAPSGTVSVLHLVYRERPEGPVFVKAVKLNAWSRDKSYETAKSIQEVLFAQIWPEGSDAWLELTVADESSVLLFNMASLGSETRTSAGRLLTQRKIQSIQHAGAVMKPVSVKLSYDSKSKRISEGKGSQVLGAYPIHTRMLVICRDGDVRVFAAAFAEQLTSALLACMPLPDGAILNLIQRQEGSSTLLIRRIRTDEWADGCRFTLPDFKSAPVLWVGLGDQILLQLSYEGDGTSTPPAELVALAEWASPRALTAAPAKVNRPGLMRIEPLAFEGG
ncbi:MAG: DNA gyrase/topoisomerase IV subunit A [Proteobacteria bacterium]|nr:DNA gyrase/topoisomerase IV subunit A [Pseudomonadota bacterium]